MKEFLKIRLCLTSMDFSNESFIISENLIDPDLLHFLRERLDINVDSITLQERTIERYGITDNNFCVVYESSGNRQNYSADEFSYVLFKLYLTLFENKRLYHIPIQFRSYNLCKFAVSQWGVYLKDVPEDLIDEELCRIALKDSFEVRSNYNLCKYFVRYNLLNAEETAKFKKQEFEFKLADTREDINNLIKSADDDLEFLSKIRAFIDFVVCNRSTGEKVLDKALAEITSDNSLDSCDFNS